MSLPQVILKKGRDMPLKGGHPWVFSGAIEKDVDRSLNLKPGSLVDVLSADGQLLGTGTWHGRNSIRVRMVSREHLESFTLEFFVKRFKALLKAKRELLTSDTTGFRLVHSDADGFPGLIVDVFGSIAVFQLGAEGFEEASLLITQALVQVLSPKCVVKRSDDSSRAPVVTFGENIDKAIFFENGLKMIALCQSGQKTGFFLDQRSARFALRSLAKGKKVLDLFCNSGGFSLSAAAGGAVQVTGVDVSDKALFLLKEMVRLNKIPEKACEVKTVNRDVFEYLDMVRLGSYDIIVCDPPAFAKSHDAVEQARKAYVRLNRKCLEKLESGNILITSSCSGAVTMEDFRDCVRIAAGQNGRDVRILDVLSQPADHTLKMSFPEGQYLKTFILQVL
ncbi:MAG: class I SAM-dependent rRNA methyltransferase [Spirochaetia bacterium]|nr:class I SAM-dependent rRNA methyltransferase [Spirochaetia bacterium]